MENLSAFQIAVILFIASCVAVAAIITFCILIFDKSVEEYGQPVYKNTLKK